MSSSELSEWIEYFSYEPFAADRNEIQLARLTMATVGGKNMKMKDYMICKQEASGPDNLSNKVAAIFGAVK